MKRTGEQYRGGKARKPSISQEDQFLYGIPGSSKSAPKKRSSSSKSAKSSAGNKKSPAGAILAVLLVLILAGGGVFAYLYFTGFFRDKVQVTRNDGTVEKVFVEDAYAELSTGKFYEGTIIDGINVGGMTKEQAQTAVTANQPQSPDKIEISLALNGNTYPLDFSGVSFEYNTDEVINQAYAENRINGDEDYQTLENCLNAVEQMKTNPKKYETAYTVKTSGLEETVGGLLSTLASDAQDAYISKFDTKNMTFEIIPERIGYNINTSATVDKVKQLLDSRTYSGTVDVEAEVIQPKLTAQQINENFGKISSAITTTDGQPNRNNNIKLACKNMNGKILKPGEVFSFNETVGQRTAARGFKEAGVITSGQSDVGMGGGICQASTTLYNAALKADLKINERHPHAWPSKYVSKGLDATVDWPGLDLKFENSTGSDIVIVSYWDSSTRKIHCEIYGKKLPDGKSIKLTSSVIDTKHVSGTEYIEDRSMKAGETKHVRGNMAGYTVVSYKHWLDKDGKEIDKEKITTTTYRPFKARVVVGTLNSDGTHAKFDSSKGTVDVPSTTPKPTPTEKVPKNTKATKETDQNGDPVATTKKPKPTKSTEETKATKKPKPTENTKSTETSATKKQEQTEPTEG